MDWTSYALGCLTGAIVVIVGIVMTLSLCVAASRADRQDMTYEEELP